nr:hypothetical protein [Grifola frondosa]
MKNNFIELCTTLLGANNLNYYIYNPYFKNQSLKFKSKMFFSTLGKINDKNNNKFQHIIFKPRDFNMDRFIEVLMENLSLHNTYTILIKLSFDGNSLFYMAGHQIGVKVGSHHNIKYYKQIFRVILLKIEDILSQYDLEDSNLDNIIFIYKSLTIPNEMVLKNVKTIPLNKNIFKLSEFRKFFSSNYLPLTTDTSQFGSLIEGPLKLNYVKTLISNIDSSGSTIPDILYHSDLISKSNVFIRKVNKDFTHLILDRKIDPQLFLSDCLTTDKYSLYKTKNEKLNLKNIININKSFKEVYIRTVFDLNSGLILCEAIDLIIDSETFFRNINNYSITIKNNKVIEISRGINFDIIKNPYKKEIYTGMSNPNFGVLDLETFVDSDGISKVYSLGYVTFLEKDKINKYYLSELVPSLDSNYFIILCINTMLQPKYHKYIWYIHNMGNFDIIFLHKTLSEYNLHIKEEFYKLDTLYKDNKMLRLIVKVKQPNNKYIKITFLDSFNLLPSSLADLGKDFNVKTQKGFFPYSFVNETNLEYIGETPDIKYFDKITPPAFEALRRRI